MDAGVVGRDQELAAAQLFLSGLREGGQGLLIEGPPGIGKTALWRAALGQALTEGQRVCSCVAAQAEARLSFVGLSDLVGEVVDEALPALPAPQARALEVALLRLQPEGEPPESRAIALGFLNALRALAGSEALVLAIDDIHWLDPPSANALAFAARRLQDERVGFLLTKRSGSASVVEQALEAAAKLTRLEVGPLSLGATGRLLSSRLGLTLPRRVLRDLVDATRGNPLFALEIGRTLAERGLQRIGEELPVPETLDDLLGTRVAGLPGPVHRPLLAVALSADLGVSQLAALADWAAVEDAIDAGLLVVEGDRVRASHPLLAAAACTRSRASERRELHLELARVVDDEELRARHLALAAQAPDEQLAATVASAAAAASARGARQEAVQLGEHALRLTPPASAERSERLLTLAQYLDAAGQLRRVTALLGSEVERLSPGPTRAHAHLLLASDLSHVDEFEGHLDQAYEESESDPMLRAAVLATKAAGIAVGLVERIDEAEAWALEAVSLAGAAGGQSDPAALEALAWTRILTGRGLNDLNERFGEALDASVEIFHSLQRITGIQRAFRGEVDGARAIFTRLLALADERGEDWSYYALRLQLCELELRAGRWEAAAQLLDEWEPSPDEGITSASAYARCGALLAAGRGFPDEAETLAAEAIARSKAAGVRWDELEGLRARGLAALLAHEPARAVASLRAVWEHTEREGVEELGAFPVAPDLAEALAELDHLDEAIAVTDRLRELAGWQEHPWGLATAKRCDAVVRLASGYDEKAAEALEQAAADYHGLGLFFDRARSLLVLGRAQRQHRKWGAARRSLEQAEVAFDEIGSPGWFDESRSELARVGARRPASGGGLTPAEGRVVELAADGRSNKEIARALFVSVKTVEGHLSHAYAKLGVRSRAQLARRMADRG